METGKVRGHDARRDDGVPVVLACHDVTLYTQRKMLVPYK